MSIKDIQKADQLLDKMDQHTNILFYNVNKAMQKIRWLRGVSIRKAMERNELLHHIQHRKQVSNSSAFDKLHASINKMLLCPMRFDHNQDDCIYEHSIENIIKNYDRYFRFDKCLYTESACPHGDTCNYYHTLKEKKEADEIRNKK